MIEKIEDWKKYDSNKPTMVFNVLYLKILKISIAYISEYNSTCEKQTILFMILKYEKESWKNTFCII